MSLILGLNYELFAIMLADSRVSCGDDHSDTCLKLNLFTGAGSIGWCGDLDTVDFVMNRLAPISIEATDPWIVFDEARLKAALGIDDLGSCPRGTAEFIVCLIDPLQNALGSIPQAVRMCAFGMTKTRARCAWHHEAVPVGNYRIFGSGSSIKPALDALDIEVRTWLRPLRGRINEQGVLRRCLMLEEVVSGIVRKHVIPSVGGMFQITYVLNDRVRAVSYEKWVSCGAGYGTYARMAVEAGRFVQSHPPSGLRLPLLSPFAERPEIERDRGRDFLAELRRSNVRRRRRCPRGLKGTLLPSVVCARSGSR